MEFLADELPIGYWIGGVALLIAGAIQIFVERKIRALRIPVLQVLRERGAMALMGIIKALKEAELYPSHTPMFFIQSACRACIKAGLITHGGHAIIPRLTISDKGLTFLDQYDWRKGNKKFPAQ